MADQTGTQPCKSTSTRIIWGFTFALSIALSAYLLINASRANNFVFGSFWFLAILPAYLCALICTVGDPELARSKSFYWSVPPIFGSIVVFGSFFFLHEGIICLIMLSPIWLAFGWAGAFLVRRRGRRKIDVSTFQSTLLLLPLFAGGLESRIPMPHDQVTLAREIVIHATPDEIWPYAVSNRHIDAREGRWTFAQDIVGIPRPSATMLRGTGPGAVRTAYWGDHINFDEDITEWQPDRRLGWAFSFKNSSLQNYTDKHISPDGQFLKIDSGDYEIKPLTPTTSLLTLHTRFIAKTHVNWYAELWGQILLGDISNNILAIIKHRAEQRHASLLGTV